MRPLLREACGGEGEKEHDVARFLKTLALTAYKLHQVPGNASPFVFPSAFFIIFLPLWGFCLNAKLSCKSVRVVGVWVSMSCPVWISLNPMLIDVIVSISLVFDPHKILFDSGTKLRLK